MRELAISDIGAAETEYQEEARRLERLRTHTCYLAYDSAGDFPDAELVAAKIDSFRSRPGALVAAYTRRIMRSRGGCAMGHDEPKFTRHMVPLAGNQVAHGHDDRARFVRVGERLCMVYPNVASWDHGNDVYAAVYIPRPHGWRGADFAEYLPAARAMLMGWMLAAKRVGLGRDVAGLVADILAADAFPTRPEW